jgi:hypothetical protein
VATVPEALEATTPTSQVPALTDAKDTFPADDAVFVSVVYPFWLVRVTVYNVT